MNAKRATSALVIAMLGGATMLIGCDRERGFGDRELGERERIGDRNEGVDVDLFEEGRDRGDFGRYDRDGDGRISRQERDAMWNDWDADGDGYLSEDEWGF